MGTITAGALANIKEAARQVGVNHERIVDILTNTYSSDGVTWDDGAAAASASQLQEAMRHCFNERGWYDERADQFIAAMVALDTGIKGTTAAPDLEGLSPVAAAVAALEAGFAPAITGAADLGNFPIGEVDDQQDPAAAAAGEVGDTLTAEYQLGQTVPDPSTGGTGTGGAMTSTEFEAALTALGLVGDGTDNLADSVDAVVTVDSHTAGDLVEYGTTIEYTYDDGGA